MNNILENLRNLGPTKLVAMAVVAFGILGFFIFAASRMGGGGAGNAMTVLFADLEPNDAAAIVKKLEALHVPFEIDPQGKRITVPAEQVGRMRMAMAAEGLPSGGTVGYELFDKPEGFGTTSFVQNLNQLRALEGELARTVQSLGGVQQAKVRLVLPKRELFSRNTSPATASVFIRLKPNTTLSREQTQSIQHLLASSVPNLEPTQVSIIDDKGKLLARGMGSDSADYLMATAEEKRLAFEQRLVRKVEDQLGRTIGYGRVRAEVSADLDFDRVTTNSEIFDPESQVARSTQTVNESSETQDRDPLGNVTVDQNLPNASAVENQNTGPISSSRTNRTEETVNFEVSRTTKNHTRESGQVRRLSVSVVVDGTYTKDPNGAAPPTFNPRPKEEMQMLEALVRSAIGFDAVRGDTVEVVNMRFYNPEDDLPQPEMIFGIPKEDAIRIGEMIVLAVVAILVILLVVRPLISRALEREPEEEIDLLSDQAAQQALAAPTGALAQDLAMEAAQADEELEQMIDINRVEGRVRASSLRKVGEIVDKHPEEAVSILRNWLYQET